MQLTKAFPPLMQVAGDVLVKSLDIPGSREVAERLKKMLPPEVREEDDSPQAQAGQMKQKLAESGALIEQLSGALNTLQNEVDAKKAETDSRERIVALQEETKVTIALAQLSQSQDLEVLKQELATMRHTLEMQHAAEQQQATQQHAAEQADAGRAHESQEAAQAREAAAAQAAAMPKAA
jgi:hypothetical protein